VGKQDKQEASIAAGREKQKVKHSQSKHPSGNKSSKIRTYWAESLSRQTRQRNNELSNKQEEAKGKAQEV